MNDRTNAGEPRILTVAEILAEADRRRSLPIDHPEHPEGFILDPLRGVLELHWIGNGNTYVVDLERMATQDQFLGWLRHLAEKNWSGIPPRAGRLIEVVAAARGWRVYGI